MGDTRRPGRIARAALATPVLLYRWHLGFLLGRRFLLVAHVGRRTGRHYQTVVEVIGRRAGRWYVMSGFGRRSDWYLNVIAARRADIRIGGRSCPVSVRELDPTEAEQIVADYERRNRLVIRIIRRALSRQVGWRYTGGHADRRRLVAQLPVLEFEAEQAHS